MVPLPSEYIKDVNKRQILILEHEKILRAIQNHHVQKQRGDERTY